MVLPPTLWLLTSCFSLLWRRDNHTVKCSLWLSGGSHLVLRTGAQTTPFCPRQRGILGCETSSAKTRKVPGQQGQVGHSTLKQPVQEELAQVFEARTKYRKLQRAYHSLDYCLVHIHLLSFPLSLHHGCGRVIALAASDHARRRGFSAWLGLSSYGPP